MVINRKQSHVNEAHWERKNYVKVHVGPLYQMVYIKNGKVIISRKKFSQCNAIKSEHSSSSGFVFRDTSMANKKRLFLMSRYARLSRQKR